MNENTEMDFYELVMNRCSVRSFDTGRSIPDDVLLRILEAGRMAPSASNLQPWRFHLVRSPEMLAKIHPCYSRDWIRSAPCLLIVSGKPGKAWVRRRDGYNSIETDLTIAMDHMILAAAYEGVGSCWIAAFDPAVLHDAIGLGPDEVVFAFTPLGYAAADYTPVVKNRKPLDETVEFL